VKAYKNLPMVVSWDGSVSLIGFRGVAIGSMSGGGAGFLAGARSRRAGERRGVDGLVVQSWLVSFGNLKWLAPSAQRSSASFLSSPFEALLF
jgi:hypothetical protein